MPILIALPIVSLVAAAVAALDNAIQGQKLEAERQLRQQTLDAIDGDIQQTETDFSILRDAKQSLSDDISKLERHLEQIVDDLGGECG